MFCNIGETQEQDFKIAFMNMIKLLKEETKGCLKSLQKTSSQRKINRDMKVEIKRKHKLRKIWKQKFRNLKRKQRGKPHQQKTRDGRESQTLKTREKKWIPWSKKLLNRGIKHFSGNLGHHERTKPKSNRNKRKEKKPRSKT